MEWNSYTLPPLEFNEKMIRNNSSDLLSPSSTAQLRPSSPTPLTPKSEEEELVYRSYLIHEAQKRKEREEQLKILRNLLLKRLKYKKTENNSISVISGTMDNLTKYVIANSSQDPACTEAFVLTFRQFEISPRTMIRIVQNLFVKSLNESYTEALVAEIANFLIHWVSVAYIIDFNPSSSNSLFVYLLRFLDSLKEYGFAFDANRIKLALIRSHSKRINVEYKEDAADEIDKLTALRSRSFLDFSARSFAEYLTDVESKMYRSIQPPELLNLAWKSAHKAKRAPNVGSIVERSNNVSYWVATEICMYKELKKRIAALKRFISIAHKCYVMNNFNTTMEVMGGLNNVAVQRLKKTWMGLTDKYKAIWDQLTFSMDTKNNYAEYRNQLLNVKQQHSSSVPFLGVFLRDITFIEDGNLNMLEGNYLNFEKIKLLGAVIHDVQQYQKVPYAPFKRAPLISKYFSESMILPEEPDETVYELSLIVEPSLGSSLL